MRRYSAGAIELMRVGLTQEKIGNRMGVTSEFVSMQLSGVSRPRSDLIPTIRALAGEDVAVRIAHLLGVEYAQP